MPISSPVIVALDYPDAARALAMADQLDPAKVRVKVGKEIFTRSGPAIVEGLHSKGFEVFLDLKFHDIPNTVAGAVAAAADLGVWMVNVHASGGQRMMEAAANAIANHASRANHDNTPDHHTNNAGNATTANDNLAPDINRDTINANSTTGNSNGNSHLPHHHHRHPQQ